MDDQFEKLEELIKDDDKIVTIASLSSSLNISVSEAKHLMQKYIETNKNSSEIHATYVLYGQKDNEEKSFICLVKGEDLEEEKKQFLGSVNAVIFSIQKAVIKNFNFVSLVNEELHKADLCLPIKGKNCVKRTLRKKVLPQLAPASIKSKSTIFSKQNTGPKSEDKSSKSGESGQTNKVSGQGNNIAALFNKAAQSKKTEPKEGTQIEKKPKPNVSISNFSKPPSKEQKSIEASENTKDKPKKPEENATDQKKKKADLFDSDTDEDILKDVEIPTKLEKLPASKKRKADSTPKEFKTVQTKQKKRPSGGNKNTSNSTKKRKRIIVEEDSDDDILRSDKSDNDEDLIENSEEEPSEPIKVEKKPLAPKNKRRKAVEKTYQDEDGYIVSQTEYVYETASEDENENANKIQKVEVNPAQPKTEKKGGASSLNKAAKAKKGAKKTESNVKQATLMNFFKKNKWEDQTGC